MKMTILNLGLTLVLLMTISISQSFPESETDNFHVNPLLLNGKSMDLTSVSTATRGLLSIVPEASGEDNRVAFYIYLKRAGKIVDGDSYGHNHSVQEIELAGVLRSALPGDQLVVDPVRENDKKWRRVLTIQPSRPQPVIQWFYYGGNKGDDKC